MSDSLHLAQVSPVLCSSFGRRVEMTEAVAGERGAELIM